jgi:hypothetical protein
VKHGWLHPILLRLRYRHAERGPATARGHTTRGDHTAEGRTGGLSGTADFRGTEEKIDGGNMEGMMDTKEQLITALEKYRELILDRVEAAAIGSRGEDVAWAQRYSVDHVIALVNQMKDPLVEHTGVGEE